MLLNGKTICTCNKLHSVFRGWLERHRKPPWPWKQKATATRESGVIGDRAHTGAMSESVSLWGETERTVEQGEEQSDFQPTCTLDFTVTFPPPARWAWVGSLSRHKDHKDTRRKGRRRQITCAGALYRAEAVSSVWRLKGTPSWVGRRDRAS